MSALLFLLAASLILITTSQDLGENENENLLEILLRKIQDEKALLTSSENEFGNEKRDSYMDRVLQETLTSMSQVEFNRIMVSVHNQFRDKEAESGAEGLQHMVLNQDLINLAKGHANKCTWALSSVRNRTNTAGFRYIGENMIYNTGSGGGPAREVVNGWYNQKRHYDYNSNKCTRLGWCKNYKQMVWNTTTSLGCAWNTCPNFRGKGKTAVLVVCEYGPSGNLRIRRPYDKLEDTFNTSTCLYLKGYNFCGSCIIMNKCKKTCRGLSSVSRLKREFEGETLYTGAKELDIRENDVDHIDRTLENGMVEDVFTTKMCQHLKRNNRCRHCVVKTNCKKTCRGRKREFEALTLDTGEEDLHLGEIDVDHIDRTIENGIDEVENDLNDIDVRDDNGEALPIEDDMDNIL